MNLKSKQLISIIVGCLPALLLAQQLSQRTQFDINKLAYNPAVAGSENYVPVVLNVRKQWIGFDEAPSSQTISAHGYVSKGLGLGVVINNDVAGPFRNSGFSFSTARHFKVAQISRNQFTWLSFGMGGLLYKYLIDESKLTTTQQSDPAIAKLVAGNSRLTFDLSFGLLLSHKDLYVGISAFNLMQSKRDLYTDNFNNNNLKRMYNLMAGYKYKLSQNAMLEPALLIKYTESGVLQTDILAKLHYGILYGGLVFRPGDAMAGLFGIEVDRFFSINYSYDYNVNDLNAYSQGSHEVSLRIKIFEPVSRNGEIKKERERPNLNKKGRGKRN